MTRPIRIAVQLHPQHADYSQIRDGVMRCEEGGADVVMNWDHFYPLYGDPDGKHFECWTMLGAWAEQTERVEFGALVTGGGYRNPDLLADMARTIDHISGGRFILGIGAGWFEKDYQEYGYEFGTAGSRLKLLAEYLDRIDARLHTLNPPPTRHIPMLIGGGGEKKTLRQVAEHGDIWHAFSDLETYRRKVAILAGHCADVGRDPSEIEHSTEISRIDEAEANALADAGVTLFTIGIGGPDYDLAPLQKWAAWRDARNAG
ncbi:MAG: LLM class F420-dependent oxidoreductase [Nakamurella sp.]